MNAEAAKADRRWWTLIWISAVAFVLLVAGAFATLRSQVICHLSKDTRTKAMVTVLPISVKSYKLEYDRWPPAKGIFAILEGQDIEGNNPRKIRFWDPEPNHILPDGTPTDWWGHALVFDGILDGIPCFHSLGKDGVDQHGAEGSDDIVSWRP